MNSKAAQIYDQYIDGVTILALSLCKMMHSCKSEKYTASLCSYSDESNTCYFCATFVM